MEKELVTRKILKKFLVFLSIVIMFNDRNQYFKLSENLAKMFQFPLIEASYLDIVNNEENESNSIRYMSCLFHDSFK